MDRVSRPLLALLLGTLAFFALWTVALKPNSSSSGGSTSSGGLGQLGSAIQAAHGAVATSDAASARHGGVVPGGSTASTPSTSTLSAKPGTTPVTRAPAAAATTRSATAVGQTRAGAARASHARTAHRAHGSVSALMSRATPAAREQAVVSALKAHHVVAMLFFNPAAADDRALRAELGSVPTHRGRVLALAAPLAELSRYPVITSQVQVSGSPTLVIVDRTGHAVTLVGFQDRFAVAQWVNDAYRS